MSASADRRAWHRAVWVGVLLVSACSGRVGPIPGGGAAAPPVERDAAADARSGAVPEVPGDLSLDPAPGAPAFSIAPPEVVAARLSRFLWGEDPDPTLLAKLRAQSLEPSRVVALADEMLADGRARARVGDFFRWWLFLDQLGGRQKADPNGVLDVELRRSMAEEAPALGVHLTLETAGTFRDLLTAPFTFVDERLARHYEMTGVTGPQFRKVMYPPDQHRVGMLTGAGLLTLFASLASPSWPAKRGWMINDPLLCTIPIRTFLPTETPDPTRSIRQQMIEMTADPGCQGCHKILDGPGLAFIGFDSFGRWRPEVGHGPGETEGWIAADIFPDKPQFDGPRQLAELLIARELPGRCLTSRWLEFAFDEELTAHLPRPAVFERSVESAHARFVRSGHRLRQLLLGIVSSEMFLAPGDR